MIVIRADAMGMCFGVRDALKLAFAHPDPARVAVHGELVHNGVVRDQLRERGFAEVGESSRNGDATQRPELLITAHGVSNVERSRLRSQGKRLVDTTCPLVRRAHDAAKRLAVGGYHVVVIGKPGHVEVEGLVGDLPSFSLAPDVGSVAHYPHEKIGVVCQTTCPVAHADDVLAAIRAHNPGSVVQFVDTICEPTKQRVRAVEDLATEVDSVVVVGGANSNNTLRLAELATARGVRTVHVTGPEDLDLTLFGRDDVVGLTAGTSTLPETIDAVEAKLQSVR